MGDLPADGQMSEEGGEEVIEQEKETEGGQEPSHRSKMQTYLF